MKKPRAAQGRQVKDAFLLGQYESRSESILCHLQLPLWNHFLQEADLDCTLSPWVTPTLWFCLPRLRFRVRVDGEDMGDQYPLAGQPRRLALRV